MNSFTRSAIASSSSYGQPPTSETSTTVPTTTTATTTIVPNATSTTTTATAVIPPLASIPPPSPSPSTSFSNTITTAPAIPTAVSAPNQPYRYPINSSSNTYSYTTHGSLEQMAHRREGMQESRKMSRATLRGELTGTSSSSFSYYPSGRPSSVSPQERRRLVNSLRCVGGAGEEVRDEAMKELLKRSKEGMEVKNWKGLLEAVCEWVEDWLGVIERNGGKGLGVVMGAEAGAGAGVDSEKEGGDEERRATDALLLLRNLVETAEDHQIFFAVRSRPVTFDRNGNIVKSQLSAASVTGRLKPRTIDVLERILDLPLFELSLRLPEIIIYVLEIIESLLPSFVGIAADGGEYHHLLTKLPELFIQTTDLGLLLPLIRIFRQLPFSFLPISTQQDLLYKLLPYTTLPPSSPSSPSTSAPSSSHPTEPKQDLLLSLDLIYHLTSSPVLALSVLKRRDCLSWFQALIHVIDASGIKVLKPLATRIKPAISVPVLPIALSGTPSASNSTTNSKPAPYRVEADGTIVVTVKDDDGKPHSQEHLGLGPVIQMDEEKKKKIRAMKEYERATAWIKETFIAHPESSMTQLTFWTAYRDFTSPSSPTSGEPPIPPSLVAGDIIKFVPTVLPAQAQVLTKDAEGKPLPSPKYMIMGIKFKRSIGKRLTYMCRWEKCGEPMKYETPEELWKHLLTHVSDAGADDQENTDHSNENSENGNEHVDRHGHGPRNCKWATCTSSTCSRTHLATHVPLPIDETVQPRARHVLVHPDNKPDAINSPFVTYRTPAPLPYTYTLGYRVNRTMVDRDGQPIGPGFFAGFILRNLSRSLKEDIEIAEASANSSGAGGSRMSKAKRRKLERTGAFGLPAPESILEGTGDLNGGGGLGGIGGTSLSPEERRTARLYFSTVVEPKVLSWLFDGDPMGEKLSETLGF